jgi:tetratricopeptide (TPR) repeat protein
MLVVVALLAVLAGTGCAPDGELSARYQLEKRYYDARQLEREAYATYPGDSYVDWRAAVAAYEAVLNTNPARVPESREWNAEVVADMERVALAAEIGLLRLGYVACQQRAFVTHRQECATPLRSLLEARWSIETPRAWALYDSAGVDRRNESLVIRARSIVEHPALWVDTQLFRDSLLVVPLGLVPFDSTMKAVSQASYSRVIATWPSTVAATTARVCRASLRARLGDHAAALADIDTALAAVASRWRSLEIRLWKGELLAFELDRVDDGRRLFQEIVEQDPIGSIAWDARLRLALLAPDPSGALRSLHLDPRAPAEVAAASMFARARGLEREGNWEEASNLFWRLCQRYPHTDPALAHAKRVFSIPAIGRKTAS